MHVYQHQTETTTNPKNIPNLQTEIDLQAFTSIFFGQKTKTNSK